MAKTQPGSTFSMEEKNTFSNQTEMTEEYWSQNQVKQEVYDESVDPWPNVKEEPILQLKDELKTDYEFLEDNGDVDLQASGSQFQFNVEHIELKEEAIKLKWSGNQPTLEEVPESTNDKNCSRKGNLLNNNTNSGLDHVFKDQEKLNNGPNHDAKSYKCVKCEKSFSQKFNLKHHILSVHKKCKLFKCSRPNCDYSFSLKHHLSRHMMSVHEELKPYKCPDCDYSCSRKEDLSRHIKSVHEKFKPFKCSDCDYYCSQKGTLFQHFKSVHEKLRDLKCLYCDYSCSQKGALSVHIMSVHKKLKPFKCPTCDYSCSRKGDLAKHMKSSIHKV